MKLINKLINAIIITGLSSTVALAKTTTILKAEPVKAADIVATVQLEMKKELATLSLELTPKKSLVTISQLNMGDKKTDLALVAKHSVTAE